MCGLKRSQNYGSKHTDEHPLAVASESVSSDGKTVLVDLPDLAPMWGMEIKYRLQGADGRAVNGTIHNRFTRWGSERCRIPQLGLAGGNSHSTGMALGTDPPTGHQRLD